MFELELTVEMIFDDALVAARNEDEMLDAGFAGFIDHVLDNWPVDDSQHFLRHGLGGRQEAGAKACDREYGFANASLCLRHASSLYRAKPLSTFVC